MSKSFCVDLNDFSVVLPIGSKDRSLERKLDSIDLVSVLMDEGFSNYNRNSTVYHRMWGYDISSFREQVASAVLGVPREATVDIRSVGKSRGKYLVTLNY